MRRNTGLVVFLIISTLIQLSAQSKSSVPNIVLIFCDDLGYADLSCYGSIWNQTPEIDKMAVEGMRFTDFYAGAPVCTPSRAGLMTGCYARRVDLDLDASNRWVLFPKARKGINPREIILPEVMKSAGYQTAIIGKWHLGDQSEFLPTRHGFDYWFGLPYSNDMGIQREEEHLLPLMHNEKVIDSLEQRSDIDQASLTQRYTEEAIRWMNRSRDQPFFIYLAHTMPHNPVAARPQFYENTSNPKKGFGASVAEISWSTGEILSYLKEEGLDTNTLVIFTSDNGGAPHWGASNGMLRGRKGQVYEGGVRVPSIAWWPGRIKPGTTCTAQASVLDFYPTFAKLADVPLEDGVKRDGIDISEYLFNPASDRDPRPYYYWHVGYLRAVRYGDWKLNLSGQLDTTARKNILKSTYKIAQFVDQSTLHHLRNDPGETTDVADQYPTVVKQLMKLAQAEKAALGEFNQKGPEVRATIWVASPKTLIE